MDRRAELLGRIDFSHRGLETAGRLYNEKDEAGAMHEIAKHFAERTDPVYLFKAEDAEKINDPELLKDAEEVLNHDIYGYHFDGPIDWYFNPTTETSRDNEWSWSLYRHIFMQPLARAYAKTKDEKYTKEFLSILHSWVEAWPVKPFMDDFEGTEAKYKFPSHSWRTLETGMRMYTSWFPAMEIFRHSEVLTDEDWVIFLTSVCDHADFLMTHYTNHKKSSNWLTQETAALLECGILFPEIKSDWFSTGYKRVTQEVKYSFDNDGIHMERTPIYHMVAAGAYFQCYRLLKYNGYPVPQYMLPTLERAAKFLISLVKPDLSTPMIGDADRDDLTGRRCDTSLYEGMNLTFDPYDLNELRAFFRCMYEETGNPEFQYMETLRREGTPPRDRNYSYTNAGIFVMRTGWGPNDTYFHVQGVNLERGEVSSHSHIDTGHVEIQIKGEDVLTDSGRYIYNSSCWKEWRHYFLSAKAHNTLYIDDHEMGKEPELTFRTRGVRTFLHEMRETEQYQLIDISHNGYAYRKDPIFHRRRVFRFPGDIFIIEDLIDGICQEDHDIRLYFNFGFGDLQENAPEEFLYTTANQRQYRVVSVSDKQVEHEILKGSENPIGGWVSWGYGYRKPIPQLIVKHKGKAPIHFLNVIAPEDVTLKAYVEEEKGYVVFKDDSKLILSEKSYALL